MTELDEELGPLALELIDEFGKEVAYKVIGVGEYDPDTQTNVPADAVDLTFKVAPPEDYAGQVVANSGGLIEIGDKKITAAALSFEGHIPSSGDTITFDDKTWTIQNVKEVYSGEVPCLYVLQVRV